MTDRQGTRDNWGLVGHEWAVRMLQQHILNDAVCHAYLFTGAPGTGRRSLALRFMQALSCPSSAAPAIPCGTCRTCRQIEEMHYPDMEVVQAEKEGGVLVVKEVRDIRLKLTMMPYQGNYRLALFLRFQEANASASNALLKTLEEAPSHSILMLTADTTGQLLPTVVSRCEVMRLRPVPVERMGAALRERGAGNEKAHLLAHISGGRPGAALRMLEDPTWMDFRQQKLDELQQLLNATRVEKFAHAEKIAKDKEAFRNTLLVWLSWWRDVLVCTSGSEAPLVNVDREKEIGTLAKRLGMGGARDMVNGVETAIERLEKNVNPRLLAEVTLLDLPKSAP